MLSKDFCLSEEITEIEVVLDSEVRSIVKVRVKDKVWNEIRVETDLLYSTVEYIVTNLRMLQRDKNITTLGKSMEYIRWNLKKAESYFSKSELDVNLVSEDGKSEDEIMSSLMMYTMRNFQDWALEEIEDEMVKKYVRLRPTR